MTKDVRIINIEEGKITAGCDRNACEGCKSSLFCRGINSEFEVFNPHKLELEKGDEVTIDMPPGKTIFASVMSLIFPLACFFLAMLAGYFITPDNELLQLLCAVVGLAAGFLISSVYFRFTRVKYTPVITDKIETDKDSDL